MVGIFKSKNEKLNEETADLLTYHLPKEYKKDQENKITDLLNKRDKLVESYEGQKEYYSVKHLTDSIYNKFRQAYKETEKLSVQSNDMQSLGIKGVDNKIKEFNDKISKSNSEINENITKQLGEIISDYNKVFNTFSDKSKMKDFLNQVKGGK